MGSHPAVFMAYSSLSSQGYLLERRKRLYRVLRLNLTQRHAKQLHYHFILSPDQDYKPAYQGGSEESTYEKRDHTDVIFVCACFVKLNTILVSKFYILYFR